jgi:hypothetical protein
MLLHGQNAVLVVSTSAQNFYQCLFCDQKYNARTNLIMNDIENRGVTNARTSLDKKQIINLAWELL